MKHAHEYALPCVAPGNCVFTLRLWVTLDAARASNFLHGVAPICIDPTANPQLQQTVQSRRGQLHAPNLHVGTRGFEREFPALSWMRGLSTHAPLPASPSEPRPPATPWAVQGMHGDLSHAVSAGHPRWESLCVASSYLLWDLELFHHAELVVHLNAALHQL